MYQTPHLYIHNQVNCHIYTLLLHPLHRFHLSNYFPNHILWSILCYHGCNFDLSLMMDTMNYNLHRLLDYPYTWNISVVTQSLLHILRFLPICPNPASMCFSPGIFSQHNLLILFLDLGTLNN